MTTTLADAYEWLDGATFVYGGFGKRLAQEQRREWRTKQRAAARAPLSDKVVYPRRLVEVAPVPKKGRQGK